MSSDPHINEDRAADNVGIAYEYVLKAHDDILQQQDHSTQRAARVAVMITLLFGALSFGLGHYVKIVRHPAANTAAVAIATATLIIAGVALAAAFLAAVVCSRIPTTSIPHSRSVAELAGDARMATTPRARIVAALTENVGKAIQKNISRHDKRQKWSKTLEWATPIGFVCAAVFVGVSVGQAVLLPTQDIQRGAGCAATATHEEDTVTDENENGQKPANEKDNGQDARDLSDELKGAPDDVRGDGSGHEGRMKHGNRD